MHALYFVRLFTFSLLFFFVKKKKKKKKTEKNPVPLFLVPSFRRSVFRRCSDY